MLTVRDLSFLMVGRLTSTSISSLTLSSCVFCLFSFTEFLTSLSSISVSKCKNSRNKVQWDNLNFLFNLVTQSVCIWYFFHTCVSIFILRVKEIFLVIFVFPVTFGPVRAFLFRCHYNDCCEKYI